MTLEQPFASGDSGLHRLDPRVKVLAAVAFSVATAILTDLFIAMFALAAGICLLVSARMSFRATAKRLLFANAFIGAMWLFLPWSVSGRAAGSIGPVVLTHEGIGLAALITVKSNAILAALVGLLGTSSLADLAHAFQRLRAPERLIGILFFCVRYVSVLHSEYLRLIQAMKVRGFVPGANLRTYRTYASLLGALVVRAQDRAERVHEAMLCRGFHGTFPVLRRFRLCAADVVAGAVLILFAGCLVVLQWTTTKYL